MAEPKREIRDYLKDILDNIDHIQHFIEGVDPTSFATNWQQHYAVLHALLIIGEAARHIPVPMRRRYRNVPWRRIVGLRNVVVHEYFGVKLPRIWDIIQKDLPELRENITRMWAEAEVENEG